MQLTITLYSREPYEQRGRVRFLLALATRLVFDVTNIQSNSYCSTSDWDSGLVSAHAPFDIQLASRERHRHNGRR